MKSMIKGFASVLFLLFTLQITFSQESNSDSIPYTRASIFNEQFDNNRNNWIIQNKWINGRIENGMYFLQCKNFKGATGLTYKTVVMDTERDYEIETSIQLVTGSGGLIFGMNNNFDHYRIEITDNNDLLIIKNTPSKKLNEILYTATNVSIIKSGLPTIISVRKIEKEFLIFINGTYVNRFERIVEHGNLTGFNVGLNSELTADYLRISYLENDALSINTKPKATNESSRLIMESPGSTETNLRKNNPISPEISWVSPSDDTVAISGYTIRIKASIKSGSDLKTVLFYLNGSPIGEGELRSRENANGIFIVEKTLNLLPGFNKAYIVATNNDGSSKSDLRHFINPKATLPVISWGYPSGANSIVNTDQITIDICLNSPSGLQSTKIIVNGEERGGDNIFQISEFGECNIKWKKRIILREGDNRVYVVATNSAGSATSEQRLIRYQPALSESRIALILGNSSYLYGTDLKNPVNDANLMEATLKELGFDIIKRLDTSRDSMLNTIREFSRKLGDYNVALFYYAGHGIQVDGINYLIPTDARLNTKEDCKWEAVSVNTITDEFKRNSSNTNVVILDACRNNPYRSWARGEEAGFRALAPVLGTIISFATSEGATAADGTGANGLFTEELVKQMVIPQPIESVFKNTRRRVMERSNNQQTPVEWSYLTGEFYFKR